MNTSENLQSQSSPHSNLQECWSKDAHSIFGMKTVREVLAFFDKQFIIVDGVRGLVLKKETKNTNSPQYNHLKNNFWSMNSSMRE
jgi:hypothetical protein